MTLITRTFTTSADIDATRSVSADWDAARTCVVPRRSYGSTLMNESFEDGLVGWTPIATGSGIVDIVNPGDPDPMIGLALNMYTGATLGSVAGAQMVAPGGVIPDTFGMAMLYKLNNVGTNPANALNVWIQTNSGKLLKLRFYASAIEAYVNSSWQLLFARGGNWFMEAWIECVDAGGGNHAVSVYLGTQKVGPTLTGPLAPGIPGNNNLVVITQQSGNAPNRQSQIAALNIGPTQLPDAMTWCSPKTVLPGSATTAHVEVLIENVSVNLNPNTNLRVYVSKDDGVTRAQVPVAVVGGFGGGELDPPKLMQRIEGSANFLPGPGTELRLIVETDAGGYFPLQITAINVDF